MKAYLSLTMAPIQLKINEKNKPETSDIYGSMFEFLDGNDLKTSETKELQERLTSMRNHLDSVIQKERNELVLSAGRSRSCPRGKLDSAKSDMRRTHGNKKLTMTFNSIFGDDKKLSNQASKSCLKKNISLDPEALPTGVVNKSHLRSNSTLNAKSYIENTQDNIQDFDRLNETQPKKVTFEHSPMKKADKTDFSNVKSRIARYLNKKSSVLKDAEKEVALWNMYQIEGQNKKAMFLQYELNLFNKLAIKGGHHLLKAQGEVSKEGEEQNNPMNENFNKSFMRMKEGLKEI